MNNRRKKLAIISAMLLFIATTLYISSTVLASDTDSDGNESTGVTTEKPENELETLASKYSDKDLYTGAINDNNKSVYDTYEVKKGSICALQRSSANMYYPKNVTVTIPAEYGEVEFVKALVKRGQFVKKGTPIAKIKTDIDEIGLKEQTLQLQSAKENYNRFIKSQTDALTKMKQAINDITDKQDKKIAQLEYESAELSYQMSKEEQLNQIKTLEKSITKDRKIKETTEIVATKDGMVKEIFDGGSTKIDSTTNIATIVDTSCIYFSVRDEGEVTSYNMNVRFTAEKSGEDKSVSFTGKIVSRIYRKTNEDKTIVECIVKPDKKVKYEDLKDMAIVSEIEVTKIDNVPIAPRKYFTIDENTYNTYNTVTCKELQGDSLVDRSVVPGYYDDVYGQIAYGLEEGSTIVNN